MRNSGCGPLDAGFLALVIATDDAVAQCRAGSRGPAQRGPECVAPPDGGPGLQRRFGTGNPAGHAAGQGARLGRSEPGQIAASAPADASATDPDARLQRVLAEELHTRDVHQAMHIDLRSPRFANLARAEAHHADAISRPLTSRGATPVRDHGQPIEVPQDLAPPRPSPRRSTDG
jgi:hypothetical protein